MDTTAAPPRIPASEVAVGDTWVTVTGSGKIYRREITDVDPFAHVAGKIVIHYGSGTSVVGADTLVPVEKAVPDANPPAAAAAAAPSLPAPLWGWNA